MDQLVYLADGNTSALEVRGPAQGHADFLVKPRLPDFQPLAVLPQLRLLSTELTSSLSMTNAWGPLRETGQTSWEWLGDFWVAPAMATLMLEAVTGLGLVF